MHVKVLSTLKTKIGMFRFGQFYRVDPKDVRSLRMMQGLLKSHPNHLAQVSEDEARKQKGALEALAPVSAPPQVDNADPAQSKKKAPSK